MNLKRLILFRSKIYKKRNLNMIREYQDKYNQNKICGKLFYPKYQRVTLSHIREILN